VLHCIDGPAVMRFFPCRRAPLLLRVTLAPDGTWDVLDQLGDAPAPGEQLYCYALVGPRGAVHIDFARGRGRNRSAWYATGKYRYFEPQPDQATMRDNAAWRAWATATHRAKLKESGDEPQKAVQP
jgi:hypothetical protein